MPNPLPDASSFFCGIDVAKRKHQALLLDGAGLITRPAFSVTNDRAGFDALLHQLQQLPGPVTVALEATGHYWLSLYETLTAREHPVIVFNPLQVHAYRRSGLRKCKSDSTDAFWIADLARIGHGKPTPETLPILLQLREMTRFRFGLTEQIGDCKRKVICVLDRVFPEYETLFSDVFLKTSRRLLAEAVTAAEFAELDLEELKRLVKTASRGRLDVALAQRLQETARASVGVGFLADAARMEIHCLLEQLELVETQRQQVDERLEALMARVPQHLTSIPGISLPIAAALLAEIGDVSRFAAVEKLVAYAGIDASVYQSGQFTAQQSHMSKRGSPHLRQALWQGAHRAIQYDSDMKAYYERRRAEGKAHGTVMGAICRKLLARVYVVLKEQRPYVAH